MNTGGADRVVDFQYPVNKFNNENDGKTTDDTDGQGAIVGNDIASGSDADKAGQSAVHCHGNIRFTIAEPGEEEGDQCCGSSGQVGRHGDISEGRCCSGGGAAVETKPAEPENKCTQGAQRKIVSRNGIRFTVRAVFSDTRSEDSGAD